MSIGNRMRTPMPHRETEIRSSGSGPVTTYTLSPEELAKYGPAKPYTGPEKKPIQNFIRAKVDLSSEEQSRRAKVRYQNGEEQTEMANRGPAPKEAPSCGLTKQIYIEQIASGETNASLERAWGMKANSLYMWINRWELKGLTADKAQQLLEAPDPLPDGTANDQAAAIGEALKQAVADDVKLLREKDLEPGHVQLEMDKLKLRLRDTVEASNRKDAEIKRLETDNAELREDTIQREQDIAELVAERDAARSELFEAAAHNAVSIVSGASKIAHDPVNHPSHYNAGGIECIDAIEAATTGLTGGQAYNTGAALKYLWRWARKNGVEDLQKARWYINRLIAAEQSVSEQTTDREKTG